jgi:hypothetical protein
LSHWPRPLPLNKKHMTEKDPEGLTPARNGVPGGGLIIANWAQICKTSFIAGLEDSTAPPNWGAKRGAVISRDPVCDAHSGEHQDIDRRPTD